jgi:hypothetical protein
MLRSFAMGVVVTVLFLVGGTYFYFASGMAPAATADPAMPLRNSWQRNLCTRTSTKRQSGSLQCLRTSLIF